MGKHKKTLRLLTLAHEVLQAHNPQTLRQLFYRLVSGQALENCKARYESLGRAIVDARRDGTIPWEWIEDRNRRPRQVDMWGSLADFGRTVLAAYRQDVWSAQPAYLEVWLEKDALSGIFEEVLRPYGVTLCVGKGYDSWSSIHAAAERYGDGTTTTVLYFGDFDPSGEDMLRSLRDRLAELGCRPALTKCALTAEDITTYHLPPNRTKDGDSRRAAFIAQHGDRCVELDALPVEVLRERLRTEVTRHMDLNALAAVREQEDDDRAVLLAMLRGA